ncbi:histone H2B type F-M-like [Oryctolagus cuniculus]|uniref:histone H2B type F-M-like n=1 Tax=Oryctolagus cuniculus TaxID=9986 RepID=UPI0004902B89|nr:histone H2B type F-M-like [Oryctolagus cuniculus]
MAEPSPQRTCEESVVSQEPKKAPSPSWRRVAPRRACRRLPTWDLSLAPYFSRILRRQNENLSLSREAKSLLDTLLKELLEHILNEAAQLVREKQGVALSVLEIQSAVRRLLPRELGLSVDMQAINALLEHSSHS